MYENILIKTLVIENSGIFKINKDLKILPDKFDFKFREIVNDNYSEFYKFIKLVEKNYPIKYHQILYFCQELINTNYSGFSIKTIKLIFKKLSEMINSEYDLRAGEKINLIYDCLSDISIPSSISQNESDTCSHTCIQTQMVIRNPLEYLNIIDTLAQNKIYFSLRKYVMNPDWNFCNNHHDSRRISGKIFQTLVNNLSDNNKFGLSVKNNVQAYKIFLDDNFIVYHNMDYNSEQMMDILKNSIPTVQNPVQICIHYAEKGFHTLHSVNVINFDEKFNDIKIINPWGREEIIDSELIKKQIVFIITNKECTKKISKIPDKFFVTNNIFLPWYKRYFYTKKLISCLNDEKLKNYLDCLNLEQKTYLLLSVYSERMKKAEKIFILKVINNILQESDKQNIIILENFYLKLSHKSISFFNFIENLEINDNYFYSVIKKISNSKPEWGQIIMEIIGEDYWELESVK